MKGESQLFESRKIFDEARGHYKLALQKNKLAL